MEISFFPLTSATASFSFSEKAGTDMSETHHFAE